MKYVYLNHIENKNNKKVTVLYTIVIALTGIISTLILLSDVSNQTYQLLPVLPIVFGACSCCFININEYLFKRWSVTLIIGVYYFRLVIVPLIMFLGNYSSLVLNSNIYKNMSMGILLLVYEIFLVFFFLSLSLKEVRTSSKVLKVSEYDAFNTKSGLFKFILSAMLIFVVFCIVLFPQLTAYTNFFISSSLENTIQQAQEFMYMTETVPGIIYRLYAFTFNILQVLIPIILLQRVYKKYGEKKKIKAVFFSFLIILVSITVMTPEKANSILIGVNLFMIMYYMYPKIIRKVLPIAILSGVGIVFGGLVLKSGVNHTDNIFRSLSSILTAYFGGPANVAVATSMAKYTNAPSIISDIVSSVPFFSYFFTDLITTPKMFNLTLYGNTAYGDQIIPMIGQGFYYFGFILAPTFSLLCMKLSLKFEKYANKSPDIFSKYIFMYGSSILALSPVIYNLNIVITNSFNILIVFLIAYISRNKRSS